MITNPSGLPPLHSLTYFESVGRLLSFTQAARELCVTQSAVSKQVRNLEDSLGFPLFERARNGLRLTPAGSELLAASQPLLLALKQSVARIRQSHAGNSVSVICTQAVAHYWLVPRIELFNQVMPGVTVNIMSTNDMDFSRCADFDFGILYGDGDWPGLEKSKLFDEVVYPICGPQFTCPDIENPADLLKLRLIQLDPEQWRWMNWADWFKHFECPYTPPSNMLIYNQVTLTLNACARGQGVALGWDFMLREMLEAGQVRRLGPFQYRTGRADYLVHRRNKPLNAVATAFKELILKSL
ncbi:LysR substrate-binding domain-containing protein [Pseudomonas sp. TTU2014-080ASC]|uniref:LysR substrate-binding domain-containing protein n=1 Tax=Pseudomonas sp. TTU2014-080ASC TaxID=1729724 RepID=UPI0009E6EF9F|nr:LysR substrate-binding domain-containing protein [Pseudomonas sp. TTU2014-080ASC]